MVGGLLNGLDLGRRGYKEEGSGNGWWPICRAAAQGYLEGRCTWQLSVVKLFTRMLMRSEPAGCPIHLSCVTAPTSLWPPTPGLSVTMDTAQYQPTHTEPRRMLDPLPSNARQPPLPYKYFTVALLPSVTPTPPHPNHPSTLPPSPLTLCAISSVKPSGVHSASSTALAEAEKGGTSVTWGGPQTRYQNEE